jgi:hypothetical protein
MHNVVVFLGPSLDLTSARSILDADYRPPAARGDLTEAVAGGAEIIGLIDGVFFQESAVGHREILAAIRSGVRVVGASSMGALRAAELDCYGMQGIGEVYRLYRDGELISDDEVALVFDPELFMALSEPLVNIRHALALAAGQGVIDQEQSAAILAIARSLYYPERTYRRIVTLAGPEVGQDAAMAFYRFIETERPDLKRDDAIAALRHIASLSGQAPG